jgi:hypothetical protein
MKQKVTGTTLIPSNKLVNLISLILGVAAAYFLTIQSIKIELAAKAENITVEQLDKKLANIEVMLKESVVSKEQFYRFTRDMETRLGRIEYHLIDQAGDSIEKGKR